MAVSPFRALAVAHLQGTWNRMRKNTGMAALWAFALLLLLLFVTTVAPLLISLGALGWVVGHALGGPEGDRAIAFSSVIFTGVTLLAGFVGGVSSGSRQLPWETLKGFPVRSLTLFAAECFAGAAEAITIVELAAIGSFILGLCVGAPAGIPFFALLLLGHVGMLLALQQLFGSIAQRVSKRLRSMLIFLPIAGVSMSFFLPKLAKSITGNEYLTWGERLAGAWRWSPAGWALHTVQELGAGRFDAVALLVSGLFPVVVTAVVVVIAWQLVSRERPLDLDQDLGAKVTLWSFESQVMGVARLQWESLWRSLPGRFGLVMPLLTLILIRGPLAEVIPGRGWSAPIAFGYASLAGTNLLFNQFGLDRHGVKVLFLLPVEPISLLRGKLLGFAAWQSVQAAMLLVLLPLTGKGEPLELLIGVLLYACIFLILAMVGQFASIWQPRPLTKNGMRAAQPPLTVILMMFGTLGTAGGLLFGVVYLLRHFAPGWEVPVLLVVGLALFALVFPVVAFNALFLERNREKLVETLGAAA
ncbi:MAG: hypothetical protein U0228_36560 [Myxococcaceae bacterium]